ncbi:MAG: ABC transporter permease, partial [Lachnospiraceae bacterium]|nr:ABC transporter permease [Lachnospiraceae bacterium]
FRHEGYKILITNRALFIILLFAALLAHESLQRTYTSSVEEQYYRDIMTELEGELTEKKESLILSEKSRYEEALEKIEQIDAMLSEGELSTDAADDLKAQAEMTLAFYPAFQRVEEQYEHIKAYGGSFVYDTGYLYLFGILEEPFAVDFLILSIGIILAVSGAAAMEYQNGSIILLCATKVGKRKILARKILICSIMAAILTLVPFLCRVFRIVCEYPLHSLAADVRNIPRYTELAVSFPIIVFILLFVLAQIMSAILVALITIVLSLWRKNQVQTIFFALLLLAVPLILNLLGFGAAKWFSLYPLYSGVMN